MSLLSRLAVQAARAYGILSAADKNKVVADYLVVAGGGGGAGGTAGGGGGGAGGLLTSTATLSTLNTYSIAVGAGGNGGAVNTIGSQGNNSSISGTGLSTITSTGGGYGGYNNVAAGSGGSGGGGGGRSTTNRFGGAGTSGQGYAGGDGLNDSTNQSGAGGGGAGAVGGAASGSSTGGAGGNGVASSISGSSVTYAGGGGGAGYYNTSYGTTSNGGLGGSGGGGTANSAGTANLGGGGGGGGGSAGGGGAGAGAAGGSGIVIISYTSATPKFVGGTITTSGGKQIHTFTSSGTLSPITPITASYLVVAGGGGGGNNFAGGGGAGGYQASSTTLYSGATYIVTVGSGGTGSTTPGGNGTQGTNSVLSGTGLTTLTSTGGGGGQGDGNSTTGINGGSGGGASKAVGTAGTGTSGQGNNGGAGATTSGGGGGGAGAAGSSGSGNSGGNGGIGSASSISGTSTYYAGGGGGGAYTGTRGSGGTGGGGNGGDRLSGTNRPAEQGTTNTGGGGGGGNWDGYSNNNGANGGSGIVIISYAGSQVFNGGLVTTSGGNTIHTFTSTGALTPLTNNLNNSLRFRSSASAYLSRTPSVASNRQTFTFSYWLKRGTLGVDQQCYGIPSTVGTQGAHHRFNASDNFRVNDYTNGSSDQIYLVTTQVFRDPSAWYHIVIAVDTTQATSSNRVKLYINGNQVTAFSTATYPSQNQNLAVNQAKATYIGYGDAGSGGYFDGYLADFNFIDGQALEPYYFGNNDANGVWKPIQYKGTYGTNGFYLTFGNTTSTTTLGYDSSPNGNNWTCNNISLTAGTTYDAMTDVPTNTSATVANYCTANPLDKVTADSTSQGNLLVTVNGGAASGVRCNTINFTNLSGKWYWEGTVTADSVGRTMFSMKAEPCNISSGVSSLTWYWRADGVTNLTGVGTFTTNDVIMFAYDSDTGKMWAGKNGTWLNSGVPASGTGQVTTLTALAAYALALSCDTGGAGTGAVAFNYGQRPFSYTPPTGFNRVNTYNLPTPTILQGNKYMDATLYTGTGTVLNVVNSGQFKPDFVWAKNRSAADSSGLYDSVRGVNQRLISNLTNAEDTSSGVSAFNSNGFSLGTAANYNTSGNNFVGWSWQAGQGSTSSNTSGSITSTVSVNTTAGFSVVTYTGTGSNATVGHGLGVAPKMVIVKSRTTAENWMVYHTSIGATKYIYLDSTGVPVTLSTIWNNTEPTSSVFSIGTNVTVNQSSTNYVAYCWAEIAGYSKFGSYTGNGSTDGSFIYLGFRPKFVLFKNITTAGYSWQILDTSRNTYNTMNAQLFPNSSAAEDTTNVLVDYLSNGIKLRNGDGAQNLNSNTYIYMAFAENPFKNSNAR